MAEFHHGDLLLGVMNTVLLRGEVDAAVVAEIRSNLMALIARDRAHLLVDCSELTFTDSTGAAMLQEANRELETEGRHMLIVNVPARLLRVFDALGLSDLVRHDRGTIS